MLYNKDLMDNPFDIRQSVVDQLEQILMNDCDDAPAGSPSAVTALDHWDHMFHSKEEVLSFIKENL